MLALKRLDAYISHTRTSLSSLVLLGAGYCVARAYKLQHADWTQKVAATIAVGAVTTAAIGIMAVMPDSTGSTRSSTPPTARMIAAAPGVGVPFTPALVTHLDSSHTSRIAAGGTTSAGPIAKVNLSTAIAQGPPSTGAHHPNHGCDGNPTSAAPPVPVGRHTHGSPVTHPSAGGCRV
jgi:hypothetical protein